MPTVLPHPHHHSHTGRWLAVILFALAMLLAHAALGHAQTTPAAINPVGVQFTPSADHAAINPLNSLPMVDHYELRISLEGQTATVTTVSIGKPTPQTDGTIVANNAVWFSGLTPKTRYVARVAAVGPSGEGISEPSNPFGNVGPPAAPAGVTAK